MDRYAWLMVAIVIAGASFGYYITHRCKEPDELTVALISLSCTMDVVNKDVAVLREELCNYLGREPQCAFTEDDKPKFMEMINAKISTCTKAELKRNNYCTDKVK